MGRGHNGIEAVLSLSAVKRVSSLVRLCVVRAALRDCGLCRLDMCIRGITYITHLYHGMAAGGCCGAWLAFAQCRQRKQGRQALEDSRNSVRRGRARLSTRPFGLDELMISQYESSRLCALAEPSTLSRYPSNAEGCSALCRPDHRQMGSNLKPKRSKIKRSQPRFARQLLQGYACAE